VEIRRDRRAVVRVQLHAMGCERFDIGIKRDAGEMLLRERQDGVGRWRAPDFVIGIVSASGNARTGNRSIYFCGSMGLPDPGAAPTRTR
jgi:hypothetical protein